MGEIKLLILEDSLDDAELIKATIKRGGLPIQPKVVSNKKDFVSALNSFIPDAILSDHSLPQFSSDEALLISRQELPYVPFILVTGSVPDDFAVNIIKLGADDYVIKDRLSRLPAAISMAIKQRSTEKEKVLSIEQLKLNEKKYRTLVERVSDGFIALDLDWNIIYVNQKAEQLLRREPGYLVGKHIWTEFPPTEDKSLFEAYHRAMELQENVHLKEYSPTIGKWVETSIYPSPAGISVYLKDLTEQKQAEEEARNSENKYITIMEQVSDAFVAVDSNWNYTYINKKASEILKREVGDLLGKNMWAEFKANEGSFYTSFKKALDQQQIIHIEDYYEPLGVWLEVHIYPAVDGLSIFFRDISERKWAEQKIIQSEENLKAIFDNASEGFILTNADGQIKAFNQLARRKILFSSDEEMVTGKSIFDFIDRSAQESITEVFNSVLKGETIQYDRSFAETNGNITWINYIFNPVRNGDQVVGTCIAARDITEKKLAEREREFDRINLRALINNTNDSIWSVDKNLKLVTFNDAFSKNIKINPGKRLEHGDDVLSAQISPGELQHFKRSYERALSGEESCETDHIKSAEGEFWSEISYYPIYNGTEIAGVACFSRDITKHRKAEEDLRRSEIRLNEAQSIVHISSLEIDLIQNTHTWSKEFYRIFGLNETAVQPSTDLLLSFIHPDDQENFVKKIQEAFDLGINSSFHFSFLTADGSVRYGYTEWRCEFDNRGNPVRLFGILQDITETKQAELELKTLEQEIVNQKIQEQKRIARAIITAQEKERNRLGQELHDNVNQILLAAKLYLDMAAGKNTQLRESIQYPMELIDNSTEEIRSLCSKLVSPLKHIDLEQSIQGLLYTLGDNTSIKTTFNYEVSNELISEDLKTNIYRIIQEQIKNTLKHAEANNLNISINTDDKAIYVVLEDDGKGFDLSGKRKGIGLSNIINRIESFNGEVQIVTNPGEGCRINVSVPL